MMPVHQMLNKIKWDNNFSKGDFEIGYLDRVEDRIIMISYH